MKRALGHPRRLLWTVAVAAVFSSALFPLELRAESGEPAGLSGSAVAGSREAGRRRAGSRVQGTYVLRAGQEELVARILSVDPELSGGFVLEGAGIQASVIEARYLHLESEERIGVELVRPSGPLSASRPPLVVKTNRRSPLPPSLVEALSRSIDTHGKELVWSHSALAEGEEYPLEQPWPPGRPSTWLMFGAALALALGALRRWKVPSGRMEVGAPLFGRSQEILAVEGSEERPGYLPPPPGRRWRLVDFVLLLLVVFLALGLRLTSFESRPMEPDEAAALGALPGPTRWAEEDPDARFKPPLYPQVVRLATRQTSDLFAARLVSLAAGMATLILVFMVARRRAGLEAAVIAAVLLALAGEALFVSQLARSYALLGLTLLLSHMALQRALVRGGAAWELYTGAAALALLTDYLALGPVLLEAAVVILGFRIPRAARLSAALSLFAALALVSFVIPVTLPYLLSGDGFSPMQTVAEGPLAALGVMARVMGGGLPLVGVVALAAGVGAGYLLRGARRGARIDELCLIAAALGVLAIALFGSSVESVRPRYVAHALPLLAIAFSTASMRAHPAVRRGLALLLIGSQAWSATDRLFLGCNHHETCANPPLPGLVEKIRARTGSGELEALAIQPDGRVDDLLYRLFRSHGGPASALWGEGFSPGEGRDVVPCPVAFCYPAPSVSVYGLGEKESLEPILDMHRSVLLFLDERRGTTPPAGCRRLGEERGFGLHLCYSPKPR